VDAAWRLNTTRNGPMRILVALPDLGAQTNYARYVVKTANGDRVRVIKQPGSANRWVSLGAFMFNGTPEVDLTSVTQDGTGEQDIAFDAVAFVPISGTYQEHSVEDVAVFDENQNLDTAAPSSWLAGPLAGRQSLFDWAKAKTVNILNMTPCQPPATGDCLRPEVTSFANRWWVEINNAGTDPVNHPAGLSEATWLAFGQPYTDRPTGTSRPAHFDNDDHFKIKTKATVSFVVGSDGKIVDGSEYAAYENRTGNTHLPRFLRDLFTTVQAEYGIAPPNMTYRMVDLNAHDGGYTTASPQNDGILPGRAYAYAGKKPVLTDTSANPTTTNATCVAALTVAGGSIGYRPALAGGGPFTGFHNWIKAMKDAHLPGPITALADDVNGMFFDDGIIPGVTATIMTQAPPIWQELDFLACADGSIRKVGGGPPILRTSWMPNQYLYHNGVAMNSDGGAKGDASPVVTGQFKNFSALPDPNQTFPLWPNPFGDCGSATDRSGNPWGISPAPIPQDPGVNPAHAHFCLDRNLPIDPDFSS
jgi:hypothetical protein